VDQTYFFYSESSVLIFKKVEVRPDVSINHCRPPVLWNGRPEMTKFDLSFLISRSGFGRIFKYGAVSGVLLNYYQGIIKGI